MGTRQEILGWLRESDPRELERLWQAADDTRREHVGDDVHLRGLVEWSNICRRHCAYCGLRADNKDLTRYRMTPEEVLACAEESIRLGYGTVVVQAGEDAGLTLEVVADVIRRIKAVTKLAVTLSLGERTREELAAWRDAGADRYLLRFETSNAELLHRIHPPCGSEYTSGASDDRPAVRAGTGPKGRVMTNPRFEAIGVLRELGYEVGSGMMVGIPGQSYESLADDIEMLGKLGLHMIGLGPWLPHPLTPLGQGDLPSLPEGEQVPNTETMTYKVLALARLIVPDSNIPSTSALATLNYDGGREGGLMRGANVVMPNLTPAKYRALYEIYPAKACVRELSEDFDRLLRQSLAAMGRPVGTGRGDSIIKEKERLRDNRA